MSFSSKVNELYENTDSLEDFALALKAEMDRLEAGDEK